MKILYVVWSFVRSIPFSREIHIYKSLICVNILRDVIFSQWPEHTHLCYTIYININIYTLLFERYMYLFRWLANIFLMFLSFCCYIAEIFHKFASWCYRKKNCWIQNENWLENVRYIQHTKIWFVMEMHPLNVNTIHIQYENILEKLMCDKFYNQFKFAVFGCETMVNIFSMINVRDLLLVWLDQCLESRLTKTKECSAFLLSCHDVLGVHKYQWIILWKYLGLCCKFLS